MEQDRDEAARQKAELLKAVSRLQARRQGFEDWRVAVASLSIGQEVTFTAAPGRGTVAVIDLQNGKVSVSIGPEGQEQTQEIPLQDLFPELGAFREREQISRPPRTRERGRRGREKSHGAPRQKEIGEEKLDRPVVHRHADSKAAQQSRDVLLKLASGSQVFVVPFRKRATLIRIEEQKEKATVQLGVFEIEVALADLEPVTDNSQTDQ